MRQQPQHDNRSASTEDGIVREKGLWRGDDDLLPWHQAAIEMCVSRGALRPPQWSLTQWRSAPNHGVFEMASNRISEDQIDSATELEDCERQSPPISQGSTTRSSCGDGKCVHVEDTRSCWRTMRCSIKYRFDCRFPLVIWSALCLIYHLALDNTLIGSCVREARHRNRVDLKPPRLPQNLRQGSLR